MEKTPNQLHYLNNSIDSTCCQVYNPEIINQAARAYQGVIPDDRYHEPYMPKEDLYREIERMFFFGWEEEGKLMGVMGFQPTQDVTLIRACLCARDCHRQGIVTKLLSHLRQITKTKHLLVGTWAGCRMVNRFLSKAGLQIYVR